MSNIKTRRQAVLFHAERQTDRQTDMTQLILVFFNFATAPKIDRFIIQGGSNMTGTICV